MNIERAWDGPQRVRLRIEDYDLLDRSGALDDHGRTELIDGMIVSMNAQHRPHARTKTLLASRLWEALKQRDDGLELLIEASVAVSPTDMPDPDLVITTDARGDGPIPLASVRLIVEISDTTLAFDLGRKAALYAGAGVPEYWVVDIVGAQVTTHCAPTDGAYREQRVLAFGEPIDAMTIAGLRIDTAGLG